MPPIPTLKLKREPYKDPRTTKHEFGGLNALIGSPSGRNATSGFSSFMPAVTPVDNPPVDGPKEIDPGPMNPPALPVMPVFPDFSTMTCDQLANMIANMKNTVNAPSLVANDPAWTQAYNDAISKAQALYDSKGCSVKPPETGGIKTPPPSPDGIKNPVGITIVNNPAPTTTTLGGVPGATAGVPMGGGGFSGGSSGSATTKAAAKKSLPWLWIGIAVVGGYFLLSGKKAA